MAAIDFGASAAPFTKVLKSMLLYDATSGTRKELALVDFDGTIAFMESQRTSVSYKPNGRRPTAGPMVLETDDVEMDMNIVFGAKSLLGSTTHTPREFMKGETVNSIALTSTAGAGKFLFGVELTYSDGTNSQVVDYQHVEYLSGTEEDRDGICFNNCAVRVHANGPTGIT